MLPVVLGSLAFAAPIVHVTATPTGQTAPITAENLAIFAKEVERCVADASKGAGGEWFGTASGTWTPSVKVVEFESIVPQPDFDAWPVIGNCIGTGGQTYPYPGMGGFTLTIRPPQERTIVVTGTTPDLAEAVRQVALACTESSPSANGRFVLSRHGSTKLTEVYGDVLYQPNEALSSVATCVAARVGARTDAPVSTQGVVVTLGATGPAGGPASESVANGKSFKPKAMLVRNSKLNPDYLVIELREKKLTCDAAVNAKDLALFIHAPKTASTVEIGRDPYVAAWWGDRQHGREPVYASAAKIAANPDPASGTATATVEAAGPDSGQYGLPSTSFEGAYCFN